MSQKQIKKDDINHWCWREQWLHLGCSQEHICEPKMGLQSRAMGQVLMLLVMVLPFGRYLGKKGNGNGPLLAKGAQLVCCVFKSVSWWWVWWSSGVFIGINMCWVWSCLVGGGGLQLEGVVYPCIGVYWVGYGILSWNTTWRYWYLGYDFRCSYLCQNTTAIGY